jgi:CRP/FNR family cyclic AMP-dependent transcriptional regulator
MLCQYAGFCWRQGEIANHAPETRFALFQSAAGKHTRGGRTMDALAKKHFDPAVYLASEGPGRKGIRLKPKQVFFSQGSEAKSIFYLQTGRAKLTVVSKKGKEATVTLLAAGDFVGEESIAGVGELRTATAS